MQVAPSGGQICNYCKWCHLVVKFATDTSGAIWWPNLQLMQVMESISGPVVPLAMFLLCCKDDFRYKYASKLKEGIEGMLVFSEYGFLGQLTNKVTHFMSKLSASLKEYR